TRGAHDRRAGAARARRGGPGRAAGRGRAALPLAAQGDRAPDHARTHRTLVRRAPPLRRHDEGAGDRRRGVPQLLPMRRAPGIGAALAVALGVVVRAQATEPDLTDAARRVRSAQTSLVERTAAADELLAAGERGALMLLNVLASEADRAA